MASNETEVLTVNEVMNPQPRIIHQGGEQFVTILNDGAGRWVTPYGRKGDVLRIRDARPERDESGEWRWVIELEGNQNV